MLLRAQGWAMSWSCGAVCSLLCRALYALITHYATLEAVIETVTSKPISLCHAQVFCTLLGIRPKKSCFAPSHASNSQSSNSCNQYCKILTTVYCVILEIYIRRRGH